MATTRSAKKVRKILNWDDSICIIKTPAGLHHLSPEVFASLLDDHPGVLVKVGPRVALVADGYLITISEGGYAFSRIDDDGKLAISHIVPYGISRPDSRVYIVGHPLLAHIKVGFADDPHRRLRELQTGSSVKLDLLGYIDGDVALEHDIHVRLEPWRLMGEWFALSIENIGVIKEIFGIDLHAYLQASCRVEIIGTSHP